jgi:hypothetical protein
MEELMQGIMAPASTPPRASGVVLSNPQKAPDGEASPSSQGGQAPAWMMDAPVVSQVTVRTGAAPMRGNGAGTVLFFGLIILVVGAAGAAGVFFWGPEKTITNRTHLATDPPAPQPLPSLPAEVDPGAGASASAVPVDAPPDSSASAKKGKKGKSKKVR